MISLPDCSSLFLIGTCIFGCWINNTFNSNLIDYLDKARNYDLDRRWAAAQDWRDHVPGVKGHMEIFERFVNEHLGDFVRLCEPLLALSRQTPMSPIPEVRYLTFICLVILLVRQLTAESPFRRPLTQYQDAANAFSSSSDSWNTALAINADVTGEWVREDGEGNWQSNLRLRGAPDVKHAAEKLAEIADKYTSI